MQTDKEKLIKLLTEFEIPFKVDYAGMSSIIGTNNIIIKDNFDSSNSKLEGYYEFYVEFVFNQKEKFIKVGIWE